MTDLKKYQCVSCLEEIETENFPEICMNCMAEGFEKFVEIPMDKKVEASVSTNNSEESTNEMKSELPVELEKTIGDKDNGDAVGFRASPTVMKKMISAVAIPLSSKKSYFNKVVFQKDDEKIVSSMTANGNTFLTVAEFYNDFFNNSWGIGRVAINANKTLDIINFFRHYEKVNFHHELNSNILLFHIGDKDKMAILAESAEDVNGYNPAIYSKIDKNQLIMPLVQDENTAHFDVSINTLNQLVERSSSEESIVFNIGLNGVKAGIGDIDNPVDLSYALDIDAINYKPPEKPYSLTIGAPFFNVLKIVDGLVHFCFFGNGKPMCLVNDIKNEDDELIGRTSYTFSPFVEDDE